MTTYKTTTKGISTWRQESKRGVQHLSSEESRGATEEAGEGVAPLLSYPEYVSASDLGVHIVEKPQPHFAPSRLEKKPSILERLHIGTPAEVGGVSKDMHMCARMLLNSTAACRFGFGFRSRCTRW